MRAFGIQALSGFDRQLFLRLRPDQCRILCASSGEDAWKSQGIFDLCYLPRVSSGEQQPAISGTAREPRIRGHKHRSNLTSVVLDFRSLPKANLHEDDGGRRPHPGPSQQLRAHSPRTRLLRAGRHQCEYRHSFTDTKCTFRLPKDAFSSRKNNPRQCTTAQAHT